MFSPLAAGLCYFALRQQPARWPGFRTEPLQRAAVPWWAVAATVAVAAGFAVWQLAERTQQVIVLGDPATYLQTASWIARHGSLPIPYLPEAFGGTHPGLTFASAGYYPAGSAWPRPSWPEHPWSWPPRSGWAASRPRWSSRR